MAQKLAKNSMYSPLFWTRELRVSLNCDQRGLAILIIPSVSAIPFANSKAHAMYMLIPAHQIALRVAELGRVISERYRGKPLTILGVLNGSVILVADLMRSIQVPHQVGFLKASSYSGAATTAGTLSVDLKLIPDIAGRDVLLVDDIFDTGRTLERLTSELKEFTPASIQTAVLLWKQGRCEVESTPDYFGFQIPNAFVVGYGLDYDDDLRHLPNIEVLEESDLHH